MTVFIGPPRLLVVAKNKMDSTKVDFRIRFDSNGIYMTDNPKQIKRLKRKFKMIDESEIAKPDAVDVKKYTCKNCGFMDENKGKFLAHTRKCRKDDE